MGKYFGREADSFLNFTKSREANLARIFTLGICIIGPCKFGISEPALE